MRKLITILIFSIFFPCFAYSQQDFTGVNKEKAIDNFDFKLIKAYRINKDFVGQEKALQQFLLKYENKKIDDPKLLYKIYFELVNNNLSKKDKYDNIENAQDLIKYGEKAFNILQFKNLEIDNRLQLILMSLEVAFTQLEDNINSKKYEELQEKYFPKNQGIDKYEDLKKLIENEDYKSFKIKFDQYEVELKSQNEYNRLADIYSLALVSFEKN